MHWMDIVQNCSDQQLATGIANQQIDDEVYCKSFWMQICIEDFAVPSWNRLLAMHHMERAKCRSLIHNIVGETVSGRVPSELALAEYDMLNRPTKKRKEQLSKLRIVHKFEYARLKRFLKNGHERPFITQRPKEFDDQVEVLFWHTRRRLIDIDNLSTKAVMDGLVEIGLLPDDNAKKVVQIGHRQRRCTDPGDPEALHIRISEHIETDEELW